ncbi:MAG: hypothetical protein HY822_00905 [Acidobacteria bacterium]|nr:hypothetical protein [Acidobacteriota bacterium]
MTRRTSERRFERRELAARQILEYLLRHPDANDTLEGISRFWLPHGGREWSEGEVWRAVELLVERELVVAMSAAFRSASYRLNREKAAQAEAFLGGSETRQGA